MTFQLPREAVSSAVGALIYSFITEFLTCLLIWLVWVHHERTSYVALLSYAILISTTASIIQQFHVYAFWTDIITAEFHHTAANVGDPEVIIANGSVGVDLVLFYIQYCCYNMEASFILFWAFTLLTSVYGWSTKGAYHRTLQYANIAGKVASIVVPIITISLMQVEAIKQSMAAYFIVADMLLVFNLAGGAVMLLAILIKYIASKLQFMSWNFDYGGFSLSTKSSSTSNSQNQGLRIRQRRSIYDKWLIVRFTVGFIFLGIFELANIGFQMSSLQTNVRDSMATAPDLSANRAKTVIVLFIPGLSPGLVAFVVFGTTAPFRKYMWETFVPRRFRRKEISRPFQIQPEQGSELRALPRGTTPSIVALEYDLPNRNKLIGRPNAYPRLSEEDEVPILDPAQIHEPQKWV